MTNPHMVPQTTNAKGVARLLGMSVGSFYNKKTTLLAKGFPDRLPGTAVWSIPAINRWIAGNGDAAAASQPAKPDEVSEATARLEHKYAGAAE